MFLGAVINLFVDCKSYFQPLSIGTPPLLLSSPNFLADSFEPRGTLARRDFPSRGWSMLVQNTPQVRVKSPAERDWRQERQSWRSSFKVVRSMARMLRVITNGGRGRGTVMFTEVIRGDSAGHRG